MDSYVNATILRYLALSFLSFSTVSVGMGQNGSNDPTFNIHDIGFGFGDCAYPWAVNAMAVQPDGKAVIGGYFNYYHGIERQFVARVDADGSLDSSFDPEAGADQEILSVALQADGKVLIGGNLFFDSYDGNVCSRFARVNPNGSFDTEFDMGLGPNSSVRYIAVQEDGKIIIAGGFTTYNGSSRNHIARLDPNGTLDASFTMGTGANDDVTHVTVQADGKILISGEFTTYNGNSSRNLARLNSNGTFDPTFSSWPSGLPFVGGDVLTTASQLDGKVLVGGSFTSYYNGNVQCRGLARLNNDGSLDQTFDIGEGVEGASGYPHEIRSILLYPDGQVLIAGDFSSYNGTPMGSIARLDSEGGLDPSFLSGVGYSINRTALLPDGRVILAGAFYSFYGVTRPGIICLNPDGTVHPPYGIGTGANETITSGVVQSDGKVVIGGSMTNYNGTSITYLTRLLPDGELDPGFSSELQLDGRIVAIGLQPDGKLIVCGDFSMVNGLAHTRIVRLYEDGSVDPNFDPGSGLNGLVFSIAIQPDWKIVLGGAFNNYNGTSCHNLIRLLPDGSVDTSFEVGVGLDNQVQTICLQSDGRMLIGGWFSSYDGIARNRIVRIGSDGSLDNTFDPGSGFNGVVFSVVLLPDDRVMVGGSFSTFNGVARNSITRLTSTGTSDITFSPGTGTNGIVQVILPLSNGKMLVSGRYQTYNGVERGHIARINTNGSLDPEFTGVGFFNYPEANIGPMVLGLLPQRNGEVIAFGSFTSYNNVGRNRIARIIHDITTDVPQNGGASELLIHPNPLDRELSFCSKVSGRMEMIVTDAVGRVIRSEYITVDREEFTMNVEWLPPGPYVLRLTGSLGSFTDRFVVQ